MAGGRGWMDAFVETVNLSHFSLGTSEAGDNSVHRKTRFRVEYVFKNVYRDIPSGVFETGEALPFCYQS